MIGRTVGALLIGSVFVAGAGQSFADVYEFDVVKLRVYVQSGIAAPITPESYVFNAYIDTDDGDAATATIDGVFLMDEGFGQWSLVEEFDSQVLLDGAYPPGATYTLELSGGVLGNRAEDVTLVTPEVYPVVPAITPTSFSGMQGADPSQDLTIEWSGADATTTAIFLSIFSPSADEYIFDGDLAPGATSYTIPSEMLSAGQTYDIELLFGNIQVGAGLPGSGFGVDAAAISGYASLTATQFITGGGMLPDFDGGVIKAVGYRQSEDDAVSPMPEAWEFEAFFDPAEGQMTEATVLGGAFPLPMFEYSPNQWDVDDNAVVYASKSAFDADFPSSHTYTMHIDGGSLGPRNQDFVIGVDAYPAPVALVGSSYSQLQGLDPLQDFTLTWELPGAGVEAVAISLDRSSDLDSVIEVVLPASGTTEFVIPAGTLQAQTAYRLDLAVVNVDAYAGSGSPGFDEDVVLLAGFLTATLVDFTTGGAPACGPDLTMDGNLNFFDIAAFIALYNSGDLGADLAAPFGSLNFFDIAEFITQFNSGC